MSQLHKRVVLWVLRGVVAAVFAIIAANSWSKATFQKANAKKLDAYKAIDADKDFGQVIVDANNVITAWNAGMRALTNRKAADMIGKSITTIDSPDGKKISDYDGIAPEPRDMRAGVRGRLTLKKADGSKTKDLYAVMRESTSPVTGEKYRTIRIDDEWTVWQSFIGEINPAAPLDDQPVSAVDSSPRK